MTILAPTSTTHRLFVANAQFDRFSASPSWGPRVGLVAHMITDSGADCASIGEMSHSMADVLAARLPQWQYDRAQGTAPIGYVGEGLNTVWSKTSVFDQPEARLHDWNMPSAGQWTRTFLLARLENRQTGGFVSVGTFHCPAKAKDLPRAAANVAKLAYVKRIIDLAGDRRVILAGDFALTDSGDDVAWVKTQGYTFAYRTSSTPMAVLERGAAHVTKVTRLPHGRAFDHDALLVEFTIPVPEVVA